MNKCIKCGSYAFNLYKEDIDQGGLCDVHYWQGRAHRAEALAQPEQEPVVDFYITREMAKNIKELKTNWTICASGSKFLTEKKTVPVFIGYTTPPQRKPLTDEQERKAFEDYAVRTICNPVELQQGRLGGYTSQELNYLWRGWKARAAHGIKGEA